MKLFNQYFFLMFLLMIKPVQASINEELDQLLSTLPPGHIHSIKVIDAETGSVVLDRNSQFNLLPASTVKAITAISAYQSLGKDFRYATSLLSDRKLGANSTYSGNLVISFSGDPSLTRQDLSGLLEKLSIKGVETIKGNIWIDGSIYDGYSRAGGASWDDHNICFAAPVSAVILDRNCFYGWLVPAKIPGDYAQMFYDEPSWLLSIDSHVVTKAPSKKEEGGCIQEVWPTPGHEYRLEGCLESSKKRVRMAFAVRDPEEAAARYVESWLDKQGIVHHGKVIIGKPEDSFKQLVANHQSEPVPELLQELLDKSDNLYADSILKTIGRTVNGDKGSYATGTDAVLDLLRERGVDLTRSRLVDGSGLSRYNMLSAEDFTEILKAGWDNWGEEAPWLAIRTNEQQWLKTGYMSGVNTMVGYVFREDRSPLIFAVLLNGLRPEQPASRKEVRTFHQGIREFHRSFLSRLAGSS
ncbi:D-alanyl-D-alanine carboxypeptidase/D-alanyl-D-alanine endopeptidase [Endozoicomonas ascidiicola]|uniref:D-alanyl-D-alanine carboxypeptidase/D-alanyl-D-alanine endopeptidase n=1 Tax=Endozoicomonas ascidiicola TaxID=1698521 RepID=UPI0008375A48|nr:D-alanyl-D-alanine carboxypeptidase/D-alanyl-D-alanine-endopeptidase [Endozoicomonas ascidiicola]